MTFSNTSVLMVEEAPQNGCCQYLGPQGEFYHIPPLQKAFQAGGSGPGFFQTDCLCPGSQSGWDFVCVL